jgi:hypothetical protein
MRSLSDYTIVLRPDDNGTFVARIPAIKGCHAWGETPEQAREELNNVFAMIGKIGLFLLRRVWKRVFKRSKQ